MNGKERVTLEMSREQAMIVEQACELFARLEIGQFKEIAWQLIERIWEHEDNQERRHVVDDLLDLTAKVIFGRNAWNMPDVGEKSVEHMRAWEVYTSLRYTRSCHDHPEEIGKSWSVCFDKPRNESGDGVPKCEIKEAKKDVADTKGRNVADGIQGQRD